MISEAVFSIWKSDWRSGLWFAIGLVIVGVASFFENGGWQAALRIPLSLLTFAFITVVFADFMIWAFTRAKLGTFWYFLLVTSCVLLGVLSFLGNPWPLVLLAFLISSIILIVGFMKSKFSRS